MRILLDRNVPVGIRRFLVRHEVRTLTDMKWPPQLENRELVLGPNVWHVVRNHEVEIAAKVDAARPGSYEFIEMPKSRRGSAAQ